MSEFIAVAGASGGNYGVGEYTTRRVMPGDVETVRARLVYALESLGYAVVSENPLQARRASRKRSSTPISRFPTSCLPRDAPLP